MRGGENYTIDDGTNDWGVRKQIHLQGDNVIVQKTFDAAPLLKECAQARQATEGQNWGEGKIVGTIDPVAYELISMIRDRKERSQAIKDYFRRNPAMVKFDRYHKTLAM